MRNDAYTGKAEQAEQTGGPTARFGNGFETRTMELRDEAALFTADCQWSPLRRPDDGDEKTHTAHGVGFGFRLPRRSLLDAGDVACQVARD